LLDLYFDDGIDLLLGTRDSMILKLLDFAAGVIQKGAIRVMIQDAIARLSEKRREFIQEESRLGDEILERLSSDQDHSI
jgi:DNA transposition AAA+ family ATPase